jgi:hypothetical protein
MKKYCLDLSLDLPLFKPGIDLVNNPTDSYYNSFNVIDYINSDLIKLFHNKNLVFLPVFEVFYSKPEFVGPIHVDSALADLVKINWVFGGKDSTMSWYEPMVHDKTVEAITPNNIYIGYYPNEVKHVFTKTMQQNYPCIVQVGMPHNTTNYLEPRCCVSLVFVKIAKGLPRVTMSEAEELFREFL